MTRSQLVGRYALFAIIATIVNLGVQRLVLISGGQLVIYGLAVIAGTVAGLVIKYILDKKWIFFDGVNGVVRQSQQFAKYTLTGVVTTLIFWATETMFWLYFGTSLMREIGAVIGLAIGYIIKYRLDSKFVFQHSA